MPIYGKGGVVDGAPFVVGADIASTLDCGILHDEMIAAGVPLVGILRDASGVLVETLSLLSGSQQSAMLAAISSHQGALYARRVVVNDYDASANARDRWAVPLALDYGTGLTTRLHPKHTFFKGELRETIRYAAFDGATYSVPVVRESTAYVRDATTGDASNRTQTIEWYRADGTLHPTNKVRVKWYSPDESLAEAKRRRGNVITHVQVWTVVLLMYTETAGDYDAAVALGAALMGGLTDEIAHYVDAASPALASAIAAASDAWLDNNTFALVGSVIDPATLGVTPSDPFTIRDWILDQVSGAGL